MEDSINERMQKIKNMIENLINENRLEEAKKAIEEYENVIDNDADADSMKAVIAIMEGNLEHAKDILIESLKANRKNFDLLYNLGFVNQQLGDFREAVKYYTYAKHNCIDQNRINQIDTEIKEIVDKHEMDIEEFKHYENRRINKVLFIQSVPDIRTNKVASILDNKGVQTDIVYLKVHPRNIYKGLKLPYKNIYKLGNINSAIESINNSDYDILYSCNEPDYLTALFTTVNKPIVHDCHDMMSLRKNISNEEIVLEYIANTACDGNIYVTNLVKELANSKFEIDNKPVYVLNNYILEKQMPKEYLDKLSNKDGEIHCVYEGGLLNVEGHHRNIEQMFLLLANNKIHVHYYTPAISLPEYCKVLESKSKYLHWEGTMEPNELIKEMTKYDIGLAILNVTTANKTFLDTTFPNKVWEYLASGLPVLFSNLMSFKLFLNKYNVGAIFDNPNDMISQVNRLVDLKIDREFLYKNKLFIDNHANDLMDFLELTVESYEEKKRSINSDQ